MPTPIAQAFVDVQLNQKAFLSGLAGSQAAFTKATNAMQMRATTTSSAITKSFVAATAGLAALGGVVATGVKSAAAYEKAWREVWTLMGNNEDQMESLADATSRMSVKFGQAETTGLKALYQITSAGYIGADAMKVLEASLKGAVGGVSDVFTAADILTGALAAWNVPASQSTHVMDILFTTIKEGKITMDSLAAGAGRVMAIAGPFGITMEQTFAALATLSKPLGGVHLAATALSAAIRSFLKPQEELNKLIHELGYESGRALVEEKGLAGAIVFVKDAADAAGIPLETLFSNVRAMMGVMPLATTMSEEYSRILDSMGNTAGATSDAVKKMAQSFEMQWSIFKETLNRAKRLFGEAFLPMVTAGLEKIIPYVEKLAEYFRQNGDAVRYFATHAMKMLGIIALVGGIAKALKLLMTPVGAFIAAAAVAYGAWYFDLYGIKGAIEGVAKKLNELLGIDAVTPLTLIGEALGAIVAINVATWLAKITKAAIGLTTVLSGPTGLTIAVGALGAALGVLVETHREEIDDFFYDINQSLKDVTDGFLSLPVSMDAAYKHAAEDAAAYKDAVANLAFVPDTKIEFKEPTGWEKFKSDFTVFFTETIPNAFTGFFASTMPDAFIGFFTDLWQKIKDITDLVTGPFTTCWSTALDATKGFKDKVIGWFDSIISKIQDAIDKMKEWMGLGGNAGNITGPESQYKFSPGHAVGGFVSGSGVGDIVPAMLEPGEFVVPRWMMQIPWLSSLLSGIWSGAQHFQAGGAVGLAPGAGGGVSFEAMGLEEFKNYIHDINTQMPAILQGLTNYLAAHGHARKNVAEFTQMLNELFTPLADIDGEFGDLATDVQNQIDALNNEADSLGDLAGATGEGAAALKSFADQLADIQLGTIATALPDLLSRMSTGLADVLAGGKWGELANLLSDMGAVDSAMEAMREQLERIITGDFDKSIKTQAEGLLDNLSDLTSGLGLTFEELKRQRESLSASFVKAPLGTLPADIIEHAQEIIEVFKTGVEHIPPPPGEQVPYQEREYYEVRELTGERALELASEFYEVTSTVQQLDEMFEKFDLQGTKTYAKYKEVRAALAEVIPGLRETKMGLEAFASTLVSYKDVIAKAAGMAFGSDVGQGVGIALTGVIAGVTGDIPGVIMAGLNAISFASELMERNVEEARKCLEEAGQKLRKDLTMLADTANSVSEAFSNLARQSEAFSRLQSGFQSLWELFVDSLFGALWPLVAILDTVVGAFKQETSAIQASTEARVEEFEAINVPAGFKGARYEWRAAEPGIPYRPWEEPTAPPEPELPDWPTWVNEHLEELGKVITPLITIISKFRTGLEDAWSSIIPALVEGLLPAVNTVGWALDQLGSWIRDVLAPDLGSFFRAFGGWWQTDLDPFLKASVFPKLTEWGTALYNMFKDFVKFFNTDIWPFIKGPLWDAFSEAVTHIIRLLGELWTKIKAKWPVIERYVLDAFDAWIRSLEDQITEAERVVDMADKLQAALDPYGIGVYDVQKAFESVGVSMDELYEATKDVSSFQDLQQAMKVLDLSASDVSTILDNLGLSALDALAVFEAWSNSTGGEGDGGGSDGGDDGGDWGGLANTLFTSLAGNIVSLADAFKAVGYDAGTAWTILHSWQGTEKNLFDYLNRMVPSLATGGIITSPTLAMVGEAGPEVVMRLGAFRGLDDLTGGSRANDIALNLTVKSTLVTDGREIASAVSRQEVKREIIGGRY